MAVCFLTFLALFLSPLESGYLLFLWSLLSLSQSILIPVLESSSQCGSFPGKDAQWPDSSSSFRSYQRPLAFTHHWAGEELSQFQQLFSDCLSFLANTCQLFGGSPVLRFVRQPFFSFPCSDVDTMQVLWLLVLCLHSLVFWGWRGIYLQKIFCCKYTWVFSFDTRFLDFCIGIQRDKKTKKLCCYWRHCHLSRILNIF